VLTGRADVSIATLQQKWPTYFAGLNTAVIPYLEAECRYSVALRHQHQEVLAVKKDEERMLPPDLDYYAIANLSNEEKEKLSRCRPPTIGAASRISGITPAALLQLLRYINKTQVT